MDNTMDLTASMSEAPVVVSAPKPNYNNLQGNVDVICIVYQDGRIIPLRFRVKDEDGEEHVYTIREYKDLSGRGAYTTSDGIYVTDRILFFECRILVLGQLRRVRLYYNRTSQVWTARF